MTTATRKLPDHGTQYRYKGAKDGSWPGCRCPKCTRAHTRAGNLRALAHLNGQPPLYPAEPLVAHIKQLMDADMSMGLIARRANVASATISYLVRGLTKSCRREKALRILAVRPGDFDTTADRPSIGSQRRIQALYAIGHNPTSIAAVSDLSESTISHLANGRYQSIDGHTAAAVRTAYRLLAETPGKSHRSKQRATDKGWAPPGAWDDNIDNPAAHPDWTGHCGTDRGWWMHRLQKLPMCQRCEDAHEEWKQEHKHLSPKERWSLLRAAQGEAQSRGEDIAKDARELLAQDYQPDMVAARLGISLAHLHQELKRHPKPTNYGEAA